MFLRGGWGECGVGGGGSKERFERGRAARTARVVGRAVVVQEREGCFLSPSQPLCGSLTLGRDQGGGQDGQKQGKQQREGKGPHGG